MAQCQLLARVLHAETTRRAGCPLAPEHGENKNSCANRARIKACPAHKVAAGLSPYRKLAPQLACPSIRGPPETTNCGDAFFHDWHLEIFENRSRHNSGISQSAVTVQRVAAFYFTCDASRLFEIARMFRAFRSRGRLCGSGGAGVLDSSGPSAATEPLWLAFELWRRARG